MKKLVLIATIIMSTNSFAQEILSPETLWKLGRVTPLGISVDGKNIVYKALK